MLIDGNGAEIKDRHGRDFFFSKAIKRDTSQYFANVQSLAFDHC